MTDQSAPEPAGHAPRAAAISPQERIVRATLAGIERDGLGRLTVRRIAADAGVNLAAISYYFGGKERLLDLALARTLDEVHPAAIRELECAIAALEGDIVAGTRAFLAAFLPQMLAWPRITAAHYAPALEAQDYSAPSIVRLRAFLDDFARVTAPAMPHPTARARREAVAQAWSMLWHVALLPRLFDALLDDGPDPAAWVAAACAILFPSMPSPPTGASPPDPLTFAS